MTEPAEDKKTGGWGDGEIGKSELLSPSPPVSQSPSLSFTVLTESGSPPTRPSGPLGASPMGSLRAGDVPALLRSAIRDADPMQPVSRIRSFDEIVGQSMAARRFNTWMVGLFALTALVLAAVGTYGVMAYAVTSRTRELGLRAALGAGPRDLIRMVLGQGLLLTLLATSIGLGTALLITRYMASLLFGVAPRDPLTFALVGAVMTSVAIAATLVPARQAMRVNPMVALRD